MHLLFIHQAFPAQFGRLALAPLFAFCVQSEIG